MFKSKLDVQMKLDEVATKVNYLLAVKKVKNLLIASDKKGEGKSLFILQIAPLLNKLYDKRVLIIDKTYKEKDFLKESLSIIKSDDIIKKTQFSGVDYFEIVSLDTPIGLEESYEFYDVVLINSINKKNKENMQLAKVKIDGAILIKSNKTATLKDGEMMNILSDENIPVLGMLFNEGA